MQVPKTNYNIMIISNSNMECNMKKVVMMVTNPCTNDARVLKESSSLSNEGCSVLILATKGENNETLTKKNGVTIKRIGRKFKPNTVLGKLYFSLRFTYAAIKEKGDIYHAHDLSTLLECYIASTLNKSRIVYDSHELYLSTYGEECLSQRIYGIIESKIINRVDNVITVNDLIAQELMQRYNLSHKPIVVMNTPCLKNSGDSTENIKPNFNGKKIILYQGTMQKGRGLFQLIESMEYLPAEYQLLMIGDGPLKEELELLATKKCLNVHFTGMIPLDVLSSYTKIADLGVILFENESKNNFYASPNKLFEYIHANVPILAPDYPFIQQIVTKYEIGILIKEITSKNVADSILNMFENQDKYNSMKYNTQLAKKDLNWEIEMKKIADLYEKI